MLGKHISNIFWSFRGQKNDYQPNPTHDWAVLCSTVIVEVWCAQCILCWRADSLPCPQKVLMKFQQGIWVLYDTEKCWLENEHLTFLQMRKLNCDGHVLWLTSQRSVTPAYPWKPTFQNLEEVPPHDRIHHLLAMAALALESYLGLGCNELDYPYNPE